MVYPLRGPHSCTSCPKLNKPPIESQHNLWYYANRHQLDPGTCLRRTCSNVEGVEVFEQSAADR